MYESQEESQTGVQKWCHAVLTYCCYLQLLVWQRLQPMSHVFSEATMLEDLITPDSVACDAQLQDEENSVGILCSKTD